PGRGLLSPCFHCGLPVSGTGGRRAVVLGAERAFCCAGCEAVAGAIVAGGFEKYYETRAQPGLRPVQGPLPAGSAVGMSQAGASDAALILERVRCAACLWL